LENIKHKLFSIKGTLEDFLVLLKKEVKKQSKRNEKLDEGQSFISFTEIADDRTPFYEKPIAKFLLDIGVEDAKIIVLLYYSIQDVEYSACILSKVNPFFDFQKLVLINARELSVSFDAKIGELLDYVEEIEGTSIDIVFARLNKAFEMIANELRKS